MGYGAVAIGQSIGLIHDVVSCKELLDRIVEDAQIIISALKSKFIQ